MSHAEPDPEDLSRQPIFNAPLSVVLLCISLLVAHGASLMMPEMMRLWLIDRFALFPARLFAPAGSRFSYESPIDALAPFVAHGWLHADWMHVGLNTAFCLAFGAPVARAAGALRLFAIYFASLVGGGLGFLFLSPRDPEVLAVAIGASGAVSGLTGAMFLMIRGGHLASPGFLGMSAVFVVANLGLALAAPVSFGMAIAWQAHLGGYLAGVLVMRMLLGARV